MTQVPTRGRAGYAGFRTMIKAVATGPRGSRDLAFEEAREAGVALLSGEVSPAQTGAFLIGLRVKGESGAELAGIAQALRDRAVELRRPASDRPLVCSSGAFDGVADTPSLSLAAALCAAGAGVDVVTSCGGRLGPKHGITVADVLAALGGPLRPTVEESERMLARSGATVVHAGEAIAGWDELAGVRDEVGLRGPIHSAEKLVSWFGAQSFVVGHTHGSYSGRLLGALERLGADRAVAVRGIEGSDVLRPGRPVAVLSHAGGPIAFPERLGLLLRGDPDPALAADLTRAILTGDELGPARTAVLLSAATKLLAAGVTSDPSDALRRCESSLDEGRAAVALEALIG